MSLGATSPKQDAPGLQRAEGLWFQDCGLVIQAERILFRVSRDFLATQSPVFRDMLSWPTPEDRRGCPIVHLPDAAEDLTFFLKALIYHEFLQFKPSPDALPILLSVLRMSHKYKTDSLWKRALVLFSEAHPTSLREWEALNTATNSFFHTRTRYHDLNLVVVLARQQSLDWVLPAAFYRLSRCKSPGGILEGPMDTADKYRVISAWRPLAAQERNKSTEFLWRPHQINDCLSPGNCAKARVEFRQRVQNILESEAEQSDFCLLPLDLLSELEKFWTLGSTFCTWCLSDTKAAHQVAKESFWDRLPAILWLPNWSVLEQRKAAVMA